MNYRNLTELHRRQAELLGTRPALRFKQQGIYHDWSWQQYLADVRACAAALIDAGIQPGDRVGLLSENRMEWLIADLGIMAAAAVNVPPHAPLTARQIHYQLSDAGVRWLFLSTREQLNKVNQVRSELPGLKGMVIFDRESAADEAGSWTGFLQSGRRLEHAKAAELARREQALGLDDLATIMYTSGTTGQPKGVMLTHGNLLSNVEATLAMAPCELEAVRLSWLPFSHIYARTLDHYLSIAAGMAVALAESAETVVANLKEIEPTHFNAVPRFYEKVLSAVASSEPAKTSRRLRDIFGPRIDWLNSGGAPLPHAVAAAFHAAGIQLYQGYGLTETAPVISFNHKGCSRIDTVGPPIPGVEVKIAPDGEVLTRGPHVMKGYWNNPQATAEAIRDGWFHTGDLGRLDDGFLSITGRKKELLVLSSGKKVVPTYLEGLLLADPCIDQAVICGEGQRFVAALIVPHWENMRQALQAERVAVDNQSDESLARHPSVATLLRQRMDAALKDVSSCEQVKKFLVLPRPFSVANEELTVSLKLRRQVVLDRYQEQLQALYRE